MASPSQVLQALQTLALYAANGALALLWVGAERVSLLIVLGAGLILHRINAPQPHMQPWLFGMSLLAALAAGAADAPVPALLACMSVCGAVAVRLDRFNPDALRWRVAGGLTLYALASLAHLAYRHYLGFLDAEMWAARLGGQAEAGQALSQGRAFLDTLATWGLWLILPLGYLSLLVQGVLVHPPLASPVETLTAVRTRRRL